MKELAKNGAYCTRERITPEKAVEYLKHANPDNRLIKPKKVKEYVSDILAGKWDTATPDNAIAFNEDGMLINGHHRLNAIIKSGVPLDMWVWRNISNSATVFDRGALRTTNDTLFMSGIAREYANNNTIAVVKFLFRYCMGIEVYTDLQIGEYIKSHGEQLSLATQISSHGKNKARCKCAPCQTVAYSALRYGVDPGEIEIFFRVANTGVQFEGWQKAPSHLKNYLDEIGSKNREGLRDKRAREILCYMTDRALYDFVRRNDRKTPYNRVVGIGNYVGYVKKIDAKEVNRITGRK